MSPYGHSQKKKTTQIQKSKIHRKEKFKKKPENSLYSQLKVPTTNKYYQKLGNEEGPFRRKEIRRINAKMSLLNTFGRKVAATTIGASHVIGHAFATDKIWPLGNAERFATTHNAENKWDTLKNEIQNALDLQDDTEKGELHFSGCVITKFQEGTFFNLHYTRPDKFEH